MTDAERWQRWFTERHPMDVLARWACGLRYFRYCRAYGGHSNDGDLFLAVLRYAGHADLLALFGTLGIAPEPVPDDYAEQELRRAWERNPDVRLKAVMQPHPALLQPEHVQIAGVRAWVWAGWDRVELSVADDAEIWDVSEAAFAGARRLEVLMEPLADRLADPPRPDRHCLCPAFYPDVFAGCV